jgi:glycosyltransferase involved in cell wall biosynthesis
LAGTDGVSLETRKWADVLTDLGHECFAFAGESDWPAERSHVVPEAHFRHPEVRKLNASLFQADVRPSATSRRIGSIRRHLKARLRRFVRTFDLDLLIVENALAIPMHVPLGLGLTEFIAEVGMPTVGHHHDFAWERARFWPNAAGDYLRSAFPPILPSVRHVVINSIAAEQLALRTGANSVLIPNVMGFDSTLPERDDPGLDDRQAQADLRSALGVEGDEMMMLQPTRIVPRKGIERSIELVRRLERPCTLVISHASGDEGTAYEDYVRDYADTMDVRVLFAAEAVAELRRRGVGLGDIYRLADLVTYPSIIEGFGNAFLEAVYYRRPIVLNRYDVFRTDIEPKGFRVVAFDGFIREDTVRQVASLLEDPALQAEMVGHNYRLGARHYSYQRLEGQLAALLDDCPSA